MTVDGHGSAVPSGAFRWASTATGHCDAWHASDHAVLFRGSHDGFQRLASPVRYWRTVLFLPPELWLVHDEIVGAGEHELTVHWQCAPGIEVANGGDGSLTLARSGEEVLRLLGGEARAHVTAGWVSAGYGVREHAPHIALVRRGRERVRVVTVLHANAQGTPGAELRVAFNEGAVSVTAGARHGQFIHGGGVSGRWATDAAVAWLESGPGDVPTRVIAADVGTLGVDGEPLLEGGGRRAVIALERRGSSWVDATQCGRRNDPSVAAVHADTHGGGA